MQCDNTGFYWIQPQHIRSSNNWRPNARGCDNNGYYRKSGGIKNVVICFNGFDYRTLSGCYSHHDYSTLTAQEKKTALIAYDFDDYMKLQASPLAVVLKNNLMKSLDSEYVCLASMAWDVDVDFAGDKERKEAAMDFIRSEMTLQEIFDEFPEYEDIWFTRVVPLCQATDAFKPLVFSTGSKGFRICVRDPRLYYCLHRNSELPGCGRKIILPEITALYGVDVCHMLDASIWGKNTGVRTNLYIHPVTGMWSRVLDPNGSLDQMYAGREQDAWSHQSILEFWCWMYDNLPEDLGTKPTIKVALTQPPPPRNVLSDSDISVTVGTQCPLQQLDMPVVVFERQNASLGIMPSAPNVTTGVNVAIVPVVAPISVDSNKASILTMCVRKALQNAGIPPLQHGNIKRLLDGKRFVNLNLDNKRGATPYVCPRAGQIHSSNNGYITLDLLLGRLTRKCLHPQCRAQDHLLWRDEELRIFDYHTDLFYVVAKVRSHGKVICNVNDIRMMDASIHQTVSSSTVLETDMSGGYNTRRYDEATGTWRKFSKVFVLAENYARVLQRNIDALSEEFKKTGLLFSPKSQMGRMLSSAACNFRLQAERVVKSTFVRQAIPFLESMYLVEDEVWARFIKGYIPVANGVLHFCTRSGNVLLESYTPELYIRQECQVDLTYTPVIPDNSDCQLLEDLLNSWWDEETRAQFLKATVYSLSRTACCNVFFVLYGLPGTAKSSFIQLLKWWFGKRNVILKDAPLSCKSKKAREIMKDQNAHCTDILDMAEHAIAVCKEVSNAMEWRDKFIEGYCGDDLSGRTAHSSVVVDRPRSSTLWTMANSLPSLPKCSDTTAFFSRMVILHASHIFLRNRAHREDLESRMSCEELGTVSWIYADAAVLQKVMLLRSCADIFLTLLTRAWKEFVVVDRKRFQHTKSAQVILDNYRVNRTNDSVLAFMKACLVKSSKHFIRPKDLYQCYLLWYAEEEEINGPPGKMVTGQNNLSTKILTYGDDWQITNCRATHAVVALPWANGPKDIVEARQLRYFSGITFRRRFLQPVGP